MGRLEASFYSQPLGTAVLAEGGDVWVTASWGRGTPRVAGSPGWARAAPASPQVRGVEPQGCCGLAAAGGVWQPLIGWGGGGVVARLRPGSRGPGGRGRRRGAETGGGWGWGPGTPV